MMLTDIPTKIEIIASSFLWGIVGYFLYVYRPNKNGNKNDDPKIIMMGIPIIIAKKSPSISFLSYFSIIQLHI